MHPRTVTAVVCIAAVAFASSGCSRLVRNSMRTSRNSSRNSQPSPEELKIEFTGLDAKSLKLLNESRAKWSELCTKYNATELTGKDQLIAVFDGVNNAHWSEKPQTETLVRPLGAAIGDILKAEGNVNWVLAEGEHICLVSPNGKVAVAPVATASRWLAAKTHPIDELIREVAKTVRVTTGEPALIGFDDGEEESAGRELR